MYCLKIDIPEEICKIDDELKAIYHSSDTVCIWVFKTRDDRNNFMDETRGMMKADRENHYDMNYTQVLSKQFQSNKISIKSIFYSKSIIEWK